MIRAAHIAWILGAAALAAQERQDLLRFSNGDQLHGSFAGVKEGPLVAWKRGDVGAPVDFKTESLRHIVLRGGRPLKSPGSLSHVGLVNGDRIPGTITAIDADHVTLESTCAGVLRIPRRQVAMLAPNPMGGRLFFYGPFSEEGWTMRHPAYPDGLPAAPEAATDEGDEESVGRWTFSGSAWYWRHKGAGTALTRGDGMPDRAVLRFDLAWKNRLSVAVAFHADFASPKSNEAGKDEKAAIRAFVPGDTSDLPRLFGNSYVLQMYSSYLMLYRTSVDADGKPAIRRVQLNNNNLRLGETGQARVEIRSNRLTGGISLFINDEFVSQWSEGNPGDREDDGFAGKGSGFGFVVQGDDAPVRVSDVVVSEWNGMPDSARSLEVDDQDVVLMANGTDRYAGRVAGLSQDLKVLFEGRHGQFRFPLGEVAEVRFARNSLAAATETPAEPLVVRLNPIGAISGKPRSGDAAALALVHPVVGEINLSLESAVMLDFNPSNQIIDDWDADF